jgi:YfiH family protein
VMPGSATLPALVSLPGLIHGFGERAAAPETREETRARVARAVASAGHLLLLRQVHGVRVVRAPWEGTPEADASLAEAPGLLLGIETADCLPLLLVDPRRRAVAAAHAGWRGTAAGVARHAVSALLAGGSKASELWAALGPAIGPCCYQVGEELRAAFGSEAEHVLRPGPEGKPHLDLRLANTRQLLAAGLAPEHLYHLDACTFCLRDRYHSYRREGRGAGRMISFVGLVEG